MRNLVLCTLLAGVSAIALHITTTNSEAAAPDRDQELYMHEPVLVYDVSGSTLLGPLHQHLALYNDGFASYSSMSSYPVSGIDAQVAQITDAELQTLLRGLSTAGAGHLGDQATMVTDVPLRTITFFRGGPDAHAHTYSYWLGFNEYGAADDLIDKFITNHFLRN